MNHSNIFIIWNQQVIVKHGHLFSCWY